MKTEFIFQNENGSDFYAGTEILFNEILPSSDLKIQVVMTGDNLIRISKNGKDCLIECCNKTDYFRALSVLFYNMSKENFNIEYSRSFEMLANMIDCSRNSVLKVEAVKKIIEKMALLGMNTLMLYMEDTYEVEGHPYFGAYRGKYTKEELRCIDDYADIFGIEVIPCIQTLAHLHNVLKWPGYESVKDSRDILEVGNTKTYEFVRDMIRAATAPFRSNRIHIGMDEACGLGKGKYLDRNGYHSISDIMKEHMDRVYEICTEEGVEPMIWSDMYITANTGRNYYDIPTDADTSLWMLPPKNLGLVYWDYYHHSVEKYRNNLLAHKSISKKTVYAGGSWIWSGVAPNLEKAEDSAIKALTACKEIGIKDVICTHWQDNGAETVINAGFAIMSVFSQMCFNDSYTEEEIEETHRRCFNNSFKDSMKLSLFDHVDKSNEKNMRADTTAKFLLYQDPMVGIFDKQIANYPMTEHYTALAKEMKNIVDKNEEDSDIFEYYYYLAKALSIKAELGNNIKKAYDNSDNVALKVIASKDIPECMGYVRELKNLRRRIWMRDSKANGYEILDIRFGGVITRLESAKYRIESYLSGNVSELEELKEERLFYKPVEDGKNELCYAAHWQRIISGCDLDDTI